MRPSLHAALGALALASAAACALAGCGSTTKTVSVAGAPPATRSTAATTATQAQTATSGTQTSAAPTAAATTRTATEPAFTEGGPASGDLAAAVAVLKTRGYTADDTGQYHASQTLRVLVGRRSQSGDGYGQLAFFFVDGRYIGTDALAPSGMIAVLAQGDTEVTLGYSLYSASDSLCCPGAGQARVRFQLNNGKLAALDPIPPAQSSARASRR
jgi:hypothetical protein